MISGVNSNGASFHVQEETSQDNETNHINETVGIIGFNTDIIPCFTPGSLIATPFGERAVETLTPGDLALTHDHGPKILRWVCRRELSAGFLNSNPKHHPICLQKDSIARGFRHGACLFPLSTGC